jgi:hypothetical protein
MSTKPSSSDETLKAKLQGLFLEYEAKQTLHELTGILHSARLLPPNASFATGNEGVDHIRLGAFAAKLIELDCAYHLADARRLLERSAPLAEALRGSESSDGFERKMLCFWHTAAGRVLYRLRDYPGALESFRRSAELAEGRSGWALSCTSDLIRCELEIARAFADPAAQRDKSTAAMNAFEEALSAALGASDKSGIAQALSYRIADHGIDEHALGALNLFHNFCDAGGCPDIEKRLSVIDAAYNSGERYRSLQMLHGVLSAYERAGYAHCDEGHLVCFIVRLKTCGLPRIRWMALQREAAWKAHQGDADGSMGVYRELLDELRAARDSEGAEYFHQEIHKYVLDGVRQRHPCSQGETWFVEEQIALVNSLRSLVSLPFYKAGFARWSKPLLSDVGASIAAKVGQPGDGGALERLVEVIEMGACRELLDVLASRPGAAPPSKTAREVPLSAPAPVREAIEVRDVRRAGQPGDSIGQTLSEDMMESGAAIIRERANDYHRTGARMPVPPVPHDPDVLYRTMQESLASETLFLRYASVAGGKWGVVHVWRGEAKWISLDSRSDAINALVGKDWSSIKMSPDSAVCREIWSALFDPDEVRSVVERANRVVIVPADGLWRVPFQAAMIPGANGGECKLLAAAVEVVLATSLTAYVTQGRSRLDRFVVNRNDDLVAVNALPLNEQITWSSAFDWVVASGRSKAPVATQLNARHYLSEGLLRDIERIRPEFFYWLGHGQKYGKGEHVEVALLGPDRLPYITTYDLLHGRVLARNKLCVLAACMTAAADTGSNGELRGFIRALQGAGAGAIMLSHWQISAHLGPLYVSTLFTELLAHDEKAAQGGKGGVSVAAAMLAMNKQLCKDMDPEMPMQALPFCLIL